MEEGNLIPISSIYKIPFFPAKTQQVSALLAWQATPGTKVTSSTTCSMDMVSGCMPAPQCSSRKRV